MSKVYRIGTNIICYTFIFWLTYTIVFLFIDGWHYKPISETEMILDILSMISFRVGLLFISTAVIIFFQ